ncbi:MAG: exonuclease SbcCD subunit D [Clostridiales bacterium]|nr:exonuclease SbcCD subunit D [Clostridiales bacterium]
MKFLHLSDLHLGKRVNEFSMVEDQRYILRQILQIMEEEQPQGVLLAGDIYDKPVPSAEAVQMFDGFLTALAGRGTLVFAVSGNHDSAERLAFGARLMQGHGVYLSPVYDGKVQMVELADAYGKVCVSLLPFIRPVQVRHAFEDEDPVSYQEAVGVAVRHIPVDTSARNILVAHQFVTGAERCDSEEVSVGGMDNVDVSVFDAFDYVALGHIHGPQSVGRETVRYCGTPLKYSFSEADQEKSVTVVELLAKGDVRIRTIPLIPLRDLRRICGTYAELTLRANYEGTNTEDYIHATLTDEEDVPDGMQKLRAIYPNLMRLEYDNRRTRESQTVEAVETLRRTEMELFEEFYELQNNQPMNEKQRAFAQELLAKLKEEGES